jgi:predicted short-subunit dehydrogenase-like oxidoreductase (DUF2520 family)
MKPSFAIVGCGKVGTALAIFLTDRGYRAAGLASRSISSAQRVAEIIGANAFTDSPWEVTQEADIVFITTPDGAITDTCKQISQKGGFNKNAIVFHCSGALPSTILESAKNCGAWIASIHPLQSFASAIFQTDPFQNIIIAVEGQKETLKTAQEIVAALGAEYIEIATEGKTLYHAAAVVTSNYLVTLIDIAFKMINKAEISDKRALKVLKPLIAGTLGNIEKVGIPEALTGPIARGDVKTVEDHLKAIESTSPELLKIYKALGLHTVDIATAKGTLNKPSAQTLKSILEL